MILFARISASVVLAAALLATPALAQSVPPQPPDDLPKAQRQDPPSLDRLFEALKVAPDDDSAKSVENRIWAQWLVSKSDTANLLMSRVRIAIEAKDLDLAMKLLDVIIETRPDYTEAWNRRATLHYMRKEVGPAVSDIRQVLAREPRHFGALSGLGMILEELGDDKRALEAFQRAADVYPKMPRISDRIKDLTEKLHGRDI